MGLRRWLSYKNTHFCRYKDLSIVFGTSIIIQLHGEVGGRDRQIPGTSYGKVPGQCETPISVPQIALLKHHDQNQCRRERVYVHMSMYCL